MGAREASTGLARARPWLLRASPVLFPVLLTGACAKARTPAFQGTLCVAHEADVASLDPADASDHITISVLSNVYDSLVDLDADMRLVPGLAVSWSSPEENVWVFRLREGVLTHDGGVLTAEDVRFSLERARSSPVSSLRSALAGVESVEVAGPSAIRVRTREPDGLLASRLAAVFILPERSAGEAATKPIGTGPYRFVRRSPGEVDLEAFPDHWHGRPAVPRVRCVYVEPGDRTLRALLDQEVDVLRWVPEDLVARVSTIAGLRIERRPSLRALYLWMGPGNGARKSPFADARVRRAVGLAIDREGLARRFQAGSVPLQHFVPTLVFGHSPGAKLPLDLPLARKLLAEAGYPSGLKTPLVYAHGAEREAAAAGEMLGAVGIRAVPEAMDWPAMRERWQRAALPFFLGSWQFESIDASVFLKECVHTRDPRMERSWNPGFSSSALDSLIEENLRLFDERQRGPQFERLWAEMEKQMPLVPLLARLDLYAVRSRVRWTPRGDGKIRVAEMAVDGP